MTTTKKKKVPFQPVFPEQYPQECQSCKTPTVCEKFMVADLKADTGCCIFICHWRHKKSRPKNDANMVTDSAPGASDFVTERNRKILLLRAFLLSCPPETGKPQVIRPRKASCNQALPGMRIPTREILKK